MSEAPERLVVDSSVAVKWFVSEREPDVDAAWSLLRAHREERTLLAAPEHLRLEVLNALLHRGVDGDTLARMADVLEGFRLDWHRLGADITAAGARIAAERSLTVYDATFAALATELDAELVTADRRLAASGACRARLLGV